MIEFTAYIAELCRLYLLVTLAAAVAGKVADMVDFGAAITGLTGLSRNLAQVAAYAVLVAETLVAGLLLAGERWTRIGMGTATAMFLVFTALILVALVRRKSVRCNCFGGGGHRISAYDAVRNGLMILAALFPLCLSTPALPLAPAATALLLGSALILFLISTSLRDIMAVGAPRRPA